MKQKYGKKEIEEFTSHMLFDEDVILKKDAFYPRISVITPSYNQGQFLERTILSVLNQNYPNLEYMIIDGGSGDESLEIIKKYERYLSYWVSERDNGQANAINKGLQIVSGDLIGWQNSDDVYLPDSFLKVAKAVGTSHMVDFVFGNIYLIDGNDNIIRERRYVPFSLEHLLYGEWNFSTQAAFWSRELMPKIGQLLNVEVLFDLDWFLKIGKTSRYIKFERSFLGCYRIHEESKLILIPKDRRLPIYTHIRRRHNVRVKENTGWDKQFRIRKFKVLLRKVFYHLIQGELVYIAKAFFSRAGGSWRHKRFEELRRNA